MIMCNDPSCDPDGGLFPVDGKYEFTSDSGTTGAFQFDSKPDAKIESLRKAVDANQVHYMVVDVDNRASMEHATIYTVNAYDTDGKKYEYKTVEDALEEWSDTIEGDDNAAIDLRNKFTDAINGNKLSLDPSEAGTVILTYEGDLPNDGFTRVSLEVNGAGEETDAYLEGQPLPADDFPESFDSVGDCMQTFAEVNSEVSGESVDSLLEDPELQDLCEDILDGQEGDW